MKQQIDNFSRFYSLLKKIPYEGDKEDLKCDLVSQGTNGRTSSLKEVTRKEYDSICDTMEKLCPNNGREKFEARRRKSRSVCLKLLQKIGVDTTDWNAINDYCRSPKIAGVPFRELDIEALDKLSIKLRVILKKKEDQLGS
ncbi:MAG: hypothetical protein KBT34_12960 [Prevotella sp.]|nr:hypothetical protein [Candidatus Prevotella equi]